MSVRDGRDYLYLIWKDTESRRQYVVGQLSKNGQFEFNYGMEIEEAIKNGFKLLISFDDIKKVYKSDILFPVFSSRLPDKKRKDIDKILLKYGLDKFDEYKLLKKSGARLPIDNFEFIDPILEKDSDDIERIFYIAGPRHFIGCEGKDCDKSVDLQVGDELKLVLEPNNKFDSNAIMIFYKNIHIGYIPRYYSKEVTVLVKDKYQYRCEVFEIQKNNNCNECVKIKLEIKNRVNCFT